MLSTKLLLPLRMPSFISASAAVCASSHLKASWLYLQQDTQQGTQQQDTQQTRQQHSGSSQHIPQGVGAGGQAASTGVGLNKTHS
jgi:hypothetical protein